VARVAAAMNTPGLKYRSFGNLPVRTEPAREDAAVPGTEGVLRQLRAAAAREAPPERPAVEPSSALGPIMAVPPIEDTLNPYTPPPAPRFRPPAMKPPEAAAPAPTLPPVTTAPPRPRAPRLVPAGEASAAAAGDSPTIRLPRPPPAPPVMAVTNLPSPPSWAALPVTAAAMPAPASPPAPPPAPPVMAAAMPAPAPSPAPAAPPVLSAPPPWTRPVIAPPPEPPAARAPLPQLVVAPPPPAPRDRPVEAMIEPRRIAEPAPPPEPARPVPRPVEEPVMALFAQMLETSAEPAAQRVAQVDWAALSAPPPPPPPQPPLAETGLFARPRDTLALPPPAPMPMQGASPPAEGDFAIFAGIAPRREAMPPTPPAPAGSTLGRLKQVVTHGAPPHLPQPMAPGGATDLMRGAGASGGTALPAAAVTVPLGEVMRLVAAGGPPATSPFDTFRAALRTPSPF